MNKFITKELGFSDAVSNFENGFCSLCAEKINQDDFRDDLSRKEFSISGLCQKCQDKIFEVN